MNKLENGRTQKWLIVLIRINVKQYDGGILTLYHMHSTFSFSLKGLS